MKQKLIQSQRQDLRQEQVLAPHLRQSLKILQLPMMELRTLIREEMEHNPTLEEPAPENEEPLDVEQGTEDLESELEEDFAEDFEMLAQLDDEWRDYFKNNQTVGLDRTLAAKKHRYLMSSLTRSESLQEHLINQLVLSELSTDEKKIGEMLIGDVDNDGYLSSDPAVLAANAGLDLSSVKKVLNVIQDFDPIGAAAQGVCECLLLQLQRLGKGEGSSEYKLVSEYLDELGARHFDKIASGMGISVNEVYKLAEFISTLDPKPGRRFSSDLPEYVVPEIVVQKVDGNYIVNSKSDYIPHVRISRKYREMMRDPKTSLQAKKYIRSKIRNSTLLVKSIDQRQQTIYRIASEIVRRQKDFLDYGISQLKPMTMAEIAEKLGIHETTVGRATSNKYMQTSLGTYEMKYFFSSGVQTEDGSKISNETVKNILNRLVKEENPAKPLSDQAIADKLKQGGVKLARRTVAKYRKELNILPSNLRRSK